MARGIAALCAFVAGLASVAAIGALGSAANQQIAVYTYIGSPRGSPPEGGMYGDVSSSERGKGNSVRVEGGAKPDRSSFGLPIPISHLTVSGRHAVIHAEGGEFVLEDSGSRNGTFVNQQRINGPVKLNHNDAIRFGDANARFLDPAGAQATADELLTATVANLQAKSSSFQGEASCWGSALLDSSLAEPHHNKVPDSQ